MNSMGRYIPGDSFIHRLDPRVKLVSVVLLSVLILGGGVAEETVVSAFLVFLVPISGIGPSRLVRSLKPMLIFFGLIFLVHLLFTGGDPLPPFHPMPVVPTYEGLFRGLLTVWRFALLILGASLLTMTTSPLELVLGMERLLRPLRVFRVPSHDIAVMISLSLRFVPTFFEETHRIREAQAARGASFRSGTFSRRIKAAVSLSVQVVLGSLRRADELALAMEARGYRRGPRTYLKDLALGRADYLAMAVMGVLAGWHVL